MYKLPATAGIAGLLEIRPFKIDLNMIEAPVVIAGYMAPSYDHKLLAYALDTEGSDAYQLAILDMETGETLPDTLSRGGYGFEGAAEQRKLGDQL